MKPDERATLRALREWHKVEHVIGCIDGRKCKACDDERLFNRIAHRHMPALLDIADECDRLRSERATWEEHVNLRNQTDFHQLAEIEQLKRECDRLREVAEAVIVAGANLRVIEETAGHDPKGTAARWQARERLFAALARLEKGAGE